MTNELTHFMCYEPFYPYWVFPKLADRPSRATSTAADEQAIHHDEHHMGNAVRINELRQA